jgi:hypothetical protein
MNESILLITLARQKEARSRIRPCHLMSRDIHSDSVIPDDQHDSRHLQWVMGKDVVIA